MTRDELLAAYDAQLRTEAEMSGLASSDRDGPLLRGVMHRGTGFVSYADLDGLTGAALDALIARTIAHYRDSTGVASFEWKTRGHDAPADLPERLIAHGLVAEEVETVMVGEAARLVVEVPLPDGVTLRRAGDGHDLRADLENTEAMQAHVFGRTGPSVERTIARIRAHPGTEVWLAEAGGQVVCAGRIEPVPGTEFAGIWGGATLPEWRGQGIYRALTSARAASAASRGVRFINSDSTSMSRPILERSGLVAVTTTTPYIWTRDTADD